jgi:ABC-type cobalamin/Fe3+-siderophores transport system ATPase subunit
MTGNHIIIENLKGIKSMDFEIPYSGVHIITATNGSGKTTLIHCIERLKNTRVFNDKFTQHLSWNVDSFEKSKIKFKSNQNNEVTYTYRTASNSWRPLTQTTQTLNDFAYQDIIIIPTLGKRVYIQNKTIGGGSVKAAPNGLRNGMARVLGNNKFLKLLKFNLGETRGRGGQNRRKNIAYLLPKGYETRNNKRTQTYFSESSFSLGEIFTLNFLFELENVPNNSLLVIDELEVALHPKVQINLLNYLESIASEKNLTVLISTHSSSLIKCAKNLIYLQNIGEGDIKVHYNCYPTLALQEVAIEEDIQPDYVFFVEDNAAESLLKEMIKSYFQFNNTRSQPLWKILPIGGYPEVLRFTERANQYLLNRRIGQYAFLDQDVEDVKNNLQGKGNNRTHAENTLWQLFQSQNAKTKFLDITPELGVWNWINQNQISSQILIRIRFPDAIIDIPNLMNECNIVFPNPAQNPREEAKNKLSWLISRISTQTNEDNKRVRQNLFSAFIENHYTVQANKNRLNAMFGPIFNRQGN